MPLKNKYTNYQIEDFMVDDDFINWVDDGVHDAFWKKWIVDHPEKTAMIEEARQLVEQLKQPIANDHAVVQQKVWDRIDESTAASKPKKHTTRRKWLNAASLAASFALLFWFFGRTVDTEEWTTRQDQIENIVLADQSTIVSNENTSIKYIPSEYNKKERAIELEGEAFFEVRPGKKFEVSTPSGTVTVLGTSFNIRSRGQEFVVKCFTGKVKVQSENGAEVLLTAGENATLVDGQLLKEKHGKDRQRPQWLPLVKNYEQVSLQEIAKDLEDYYSVKVVFEKGIENQLVSASFQFGTLAETAQTLTWPLHLRYEIKPDTLYIYGQEK